VDLKQCVGVQEQDSERHRLTLIADT